MLRTLDFSHQNIVREYFNENYASLRHPESRNLTRNLKKKTMLDHPMKRIITFLSFGRHELQSLTKNIPAAASTKL